MTEVLVRGSFLVLGFGLAACGSDEEEKPGTDVSVPDDVAEADEADTDADTDSDSDTDTDTDTDTDPVIPPPPVSLPPVACPIPVDTVVLTDCAADPTRAAFVGGVGHPNIQDAIDAAGTGETITVCPGVWPGELRLGDEKILAAADPAPGATAIEGATISWILEVKDATVQGLTLRDGRRTGNGAAVSGEGIVLLECVYADRNLSSGPETYGGAVYVDGQLTVRNAAFGDNRATYGGGAVHATHLVVEDSHFSANRSGYQSGAIDVRASLVVRRSSFLENRAAYDGGALSSTGSLEVEGSTFDGNRSGYEGGAIAFGGWDPYPLVIRDSVFQANEAGYEGGAISIGSWATDPATITDSVFLENQAVFGAGGIHVGTWAGVDLTVTGSTFSANTGGACGALGAGGWLEEGGRITLASSVFEDNVATFPESGGALFLWSQTAPIEVVGTDLVVHRNDGLGGAVSFGSVDHAFVCTSCDFGTGADDNLPGDATLAGVQIAELPFDFVL